MFSLAELPASHIQSPGLGRDWLIRVATSCSPILQLLADIAPSGWYGRTSPASFQAKEDETLQAFWAHSQAGTLNALLEDGPTVESSQGSKAHTGSHGECLTLSISEWPSEGVVCSLSDTLETGNVPLRFFLSKKACQGILRRSEARGKELPLALEQALQAVVART